MPNDWTSARPITGRLGDVPRGHRPLALGGLLWVAVATASLALWP